MRNAVLRRWVLGAVVVVAALAGVLPGAAPPPAAAFPEAPWFRPGYAYDANMPDPFILVDGSTYYAYATNTGGSLLPVMTSTDPVTWTRVGLASGIGVVAAASLDDVAAYAGKASTKANPP